MLKNIEEVTLQLPFPPGNCLLMRKAVHRYCNSMPFGNISDRLTQDPLHQSHYPMVSLTDIIIIVLIVLLLELNAVCVGMKLAVVFSALRSILKHLLLFCLYIVLFYKTKLPKGHVYDNCLGL